MCSSKCFMICMGALRRFDRQAQALETIKWSFGIFMSEFVMTQAGCKARISGVEERPRKTHHRALVAADHFALGHLHNELAVAPEARSQRPQRSRVRGVRVGTGERRCRGHGIIGPNVGTNVMRGSANYCGAPARAAATALMVSFAITRAKRGAPAIFFGSTST